MFVRGFYRFARLCFTLGLFCVTTTPALSATTDPPPSQPIPWNQLGSQATAQYSGDGLAVNATAEGARLRCVFQKLEGDVTAAGLWLRSTAPGEADRAQVAADRLRRDAGPTTLLERRGRVDLASGHARYIRPRLTEEYSVSVDGIRQDFVVTDRPAGTGPLRLELALQGARAEVSPEGAQLVLNESGRKLNYNRLQVTDATARELAAWMELISPTNLAVVVEDAGALYPLRIDPTFSDANWSALGSGMNTTVYALAVSGNDLYAGGAFRTAGGSPASCIAKWDGTNWTALGSGMFYPFDFKATATVYALAVSGGDLYAGGLFTKAGGNPAASIAKWDGTNWSALGSGMSGAAYPVVNALAVLGSDLYAGGSFRMAGGGTATNIAKWDGTSWSALGSGMDSSVTALAVSGSDLYAGGYFTTPANHIAKWDGTNWSALGSGVNGPVYSLAVSGTDLYAGAYVTIAKWDGSTWSALGTGVGNQFGQGWVYALAVSGNDLYAGGNFTTAGGSQANYIAKWDGTTWNPLGSGMNNGVYALAVSGSSLYAGGWFTTAGGGPANRIAKARIASAAESITASGSSATIQFSGVVGYEYHVQRTDSLTSSMTWTALTTTPLSPAGDGSLTFTDTNAPPGTAYYRLAQH